MNKYLIFSLLGMKTEIVIASISVLIIAIIGFLLITEKFESVLESISPYFWAGMGIGIAFGFSIIGAAWYAYFKNYL
jgi:hypothetical protein